MERNLRGVKKHGYGTVGNDMHFNLVLIVSFRRLVLKDGKSCLDLVLDSSPIIHMVFVFMIIFLRETKLLVEYFLWGIPSKLCVVYVSIYKMVVDH